MDNKIFLLRISYAEHDHIEQILDKVLSKTFEEYFIYNLNECILPPLVMKIYEEQYQNASN